MFTNNETTDSIRGEITIPFCSTRKTNKKCALHGSEKNLGMSPNEAKIDSLCYFVCDRIQMLP